MAKSAFADALARGAANQANLEIPKGASFDYTDGQWKDGLTGETVVLRPKAPSAGMPAPSSGSWLPVVAVVGAVGAFWWWRSK
jgi:cobalamin biosynthesis Mg chelatase CobN